MLKTLITTVPFGEINKLPIEMMENNNIDYTINSLNWKLSENELLEMVSDFDIIVAWTEPITKKIINKARNLKLISRVGVRLKVILLKNKHFIFTK